MKKLLTALFSFLSLFSFSQSPEIIPTVVSPNTASLGSTVLKPVTLASGAATAQIPLYELKEGSISVPVSLHYNGTGVKPDDHPGWVGQNWQLNAGGAITRRIKGVQDELLWKRVAYISNGQQITENSPYGYAYNFTVNQSPTWSAPANISQIVGNEESKWWAEAEPDEFVFNFNGHQGKFYIGADGLVKVEADRRIDVTPVIMLNIPYYNSNDFSYSLYPGIFNNRDYYDFNDTKIVGFTVKTEDGTKYSFGYPNSSWQQIMDDDCKNVEFSIDFFAQLYLEERWDSWFLTEIESPTGDKVTFEYEQGYPVMAMNYSAAFEFSSGSYKPKGILGIFGAVSSSNKTYHEGFSGRLVRPSYLKKISSSRLDIRFSISETNELKFPYARLVNDLMIRARDTYDPSVRPESPITAYARIPVLGGVLGSPNVFPASATNSNGILVLNEILNFNNVKYYQLDSILIYRKPYFNGTEYSKGFVAGYTNNDQVRLQLLSLKEIGSGGVQKPAYEFQYDNTALPGYFSLRTDHWGYFNDVQPFILVNQNGDVDPVSLANFKSLKNPVAAKTGAGLLTSFRSPTGELTNFTYQPNRYNRIVTRNVTTGTFSITSVTEQDGCGMRIQSIAVKDPVTNQTLSTNYTYTAGILGGDIQYYWPNYKGRLANGNQYTRQRFVTESMLPMSQTGAGGGIGYSQVEEAQTGNGKTTYLFSNFDTNPDENFLSTLDVESSPYSVFSNKVAERGKLLEKKIYDNSGQLITFIKNIYSTPPSRTGEYVPAVYTRRFKVLEGLAVEGTSYKNFIYPYRLSTVETRQYGAGQELLSTTNYQFSDLDNLRSESLLNSDGKSIRKEYWYANDMVVTGDDPGGIHSSMVQKRMFSQVIEEKQYSESTLLQKKRINYHQPYANTYLPQEVRLQIDAEPLRITEQFHQYDAKGRPTLFSKAEDVKIGYIWEGGVQAPIAKIQNAQAGDYAYTSFETADNGGWIVDNHYNNFQLQFTGKWSHVFIQEGIEAIYKTGLTPSRRYILSFCHYNDEPIIEGTGLVIQNKVIRNLKDNWKQVTMEITGVSSISIDNPAYESTVLDELRLYPKDAQMVSYTYDPLVGMTSQCDVNGRMLLYEYDNLGRLNFIRDDKGNILKRLCYTYAGQADACKVFYNVAKSQTFTRQNCEPGFEGGTYTYSVPANKYPAMSQAEADALAIADIAANGQNEANLHGACNRVFWLSVYKSQSFTRNNCINGATGGQYLYEVPAGTYTSTIGQPEADQKALDDIALNGQNAANQLAACTGGYTVYAKLFIENTTYTGNETWGKVVVRFFSDANFTVPISVSGLVVNYGYQYSNDATQEYTYNEYPKVCNGTSTTIRDYMMIFRADSDLAIGNYFLLKPGTGYIHFEGLVWP